LFFPVCLVCFSVLFLRATAATAVVHISQHNSVHSSVHLSVCHMGRSVKNGASKNHQIFTVSCVEDSSFKIRKTFP